MFVPKILFEGRGCGMGGRLQFRPILAGYLTMIIMLLVISAILSFLLAFTSLRESSVQWFFLPVTLLTLFIGGVIAGYRAGEKGWYYGAIGGALFTLTVWLISYLGFDFTPTTKNFILYVAYILLAMLGGMIGVNMSPRKA
jgi:putative membrane protein (TIGR04086 family)